MRVLVVEDHEKVRGFLQRGLTEHGYAVDVASDGDAGFALTRTESYDAIILDVMLPGLGGLELLGALRERGDDTPVLLLTARDAVEDRVSGLDLGADDYLTKPFAFEELLARLRALLRRGRSGSPGLIEFAGVTLDPVSHRVWSLGEPVELTNREYALLEFFIRRPRRLLSRAEIADHVWGMDFESGTNVIDVYVSHLRRKLDAGRPGSLFRAVKGAGYMMVDPATDNATHA
ncbi:MAG TPA: response regulator transcription factor [Armatimonadota bacterium]|nr:response regulator transcription factor [Armatimonadota bacterium]